MEFPASVEPASAPAYGSSVTTTPMEGVMSSVQSEMGGRQQVVGVNSVVNVGPFVPLSLPKIGYVPISNNGAIQSNTGSHQNHTVSDPNDEHSDR